MTAIINDAAAAAAPGSHVAAAAAPSGSVLRFALRADATLCAGLGLLIAMAADPLSRLFGLSSTAEWIGGAALAAYGVVEYAAAGIRLRPVPRSAPPGVTPT